MSLLGKIQSKVKVAKNLHTKFGKVQFSYRNVESIYEAVKPILAEEKCSLVLSDELVFIGDRYYIKATARIKDEKGEVVGEAVAFAREAITKAGMDEAQITGSASSYARKYALGGLLLLDDNKDIDSLDNRQHNVSVEPAPSADYPYNHTDKLLKWKRAVAHELGRLGIKENQKILAFFEFAGIDKDDASALQFLYEGGDLQNLANDFLAGAK